VPLFAYANLRLDADRALAVPLADGLARVEIRLRARDVASLSALHAAAGASRVSSELDVVRVADGSFVIAFPSVGFARISPAERLVEHAVEDDAAPSSITHFLLDQLLPRAIPMGGALPLHAAALALGDDAALLVAGASGQGKSTLTVALSSSLPLLCDDCVAVERTDDSLMAWPSYPGARLWPDSAERLANVTHTSGDKVRIAVDGRASGPRRVAAIAILGDDRDPAALERVRGTRAMELLVRHVFRLDRADASALERELSLLAFAASAVPVVHLSYARRYEALSDVTRAVADFVREIEARPEPTR
jgi:hypothetical protein